MGNCHCSCRTLKKEFDADRLDFDLDEFDGRWVEFFGSSRVLKDRRQYLAFRVLLFVLTLIIFVWSLLDSALDESLRCWLIYLTHQGLFIELVYLGAAAGTTYLSFWYVDVDGTPKAPRKMPWYCKLAWVLQAIALPGSFLIFVLYWGLVYDGSLHAISPFTHGVNFIIMCFDQGFSNQPMYLVHGAIFMCYSLFYVAWSVVHYVSGLKDCDNNRYIYSSLNWAYPGAAGKIAAAVVLVAAPLLNVLFWGCLFKRAKGPDAASDARPPKAAGDKVAPSGDIAV